MHAKNFVLGSGYAYFLPNAGGGERYLGDSPSISLNVTTETLAMFDSDTRIAVKVADVVTQITRVATTTIRSITPENLALFIGGENETGSQGAVTATVQTSRAFRDRFVQLGAGPGVRNVTAVAIETAALGDPLVLGTDYTLDAASGRVYFLSTSTAFTEGEDVEITYSAPEASFSRVVSADDVGQIGAFRFVSKNTYGEERDMYFPVCKVTPEGDFALKSRDTPQELTFTLEVLQPEDGTPAVYIDGRPA
jgi:hypothetical protein